MILLILFFVAVMFNELFVKFVDYENKLLTAFRVSDTTLVKPNFDFRQFNTIT